MTRTIAAPRRSTARRITAFALATAAAIVAACSEGKPSTEVTVAPTPGTPTTPAVSESTVTPARTPDSTPVVSRVTGSYAEGEAAFSERKYKEASEMFASYVERRPDNAWGHYMLGLSSWKAGELDEAQRAFVRSLELDPKNVKTLLNLSRVLLDRNDAKEALPYVTHAVSIDSTSAEVYRMVGRVRSTLLQHEEAVLAYRTALSLNPKDVWSMNNMALVLLQQGNFTDAIPPLARAVQIDSTVAVFHNNLGIALERSGQNVAAAVAYNGALKADSNYKKASQSLARLAGRPDEVGVTPIDLAAIAETFDKEIREGKTVVVKK